MLQGAKPILLFKAFFLFNRKDFQGEHLSWLSFSVKMEVWKKTWHEHQISKPSFFQCFPKFCFDRSLNCSDSRYESNRIFVLGWVFFLQTSFDVLTSHFWRNFKKSFERYCWPELKFENIFHLWTFFVKLWELKDCHSGQFETINARYISRY